MSKLILHYAPDNASAIIRLALHFCQMPFEARLVDRSVQAQRAPSYLALNPNGKIPTLETPDGVLFETAAILLWIDENAPDKRVLPSSGTLRLAALKWLMHLTSHLHPLLNMSFYPHRYCDAQYTQDFTKRLSRQIAEGFALIEAHLLPEIDIIKDAPALGFYLGFLTRWAQLYADPSIDSLQEAHKLHSILHILEQNQWLQDALLEEGIAGNIFTSPSVPAGDLKTIKGV